MATAALPHLSRALLATNLFTPPRASEAAAEVDLLTLYWLVVSLFSATLIFLLCVFFAVKYRRRSDAEIPLAASGNVILEIVWAVIPLALFLFMFVWGAKLYFNLVSGPADARNIYVLGKQWMWVVEHPEGKRELNSLHVPVNRSIKLTMISEDVIHSFYVPAFRVKRDVYPGRYTHLFFTPTREGEYHLFCSEYCGAEHSLMIGKVVVMKPVEYEQWLAGAAASESLATRGEKLFTRLGCGSCHGAQAGDRGPSLVGLYGRDVPLQGGGVVAADRSYIRQSILEPNASIVAGYPPIMPTYKGQISEEGLLQIISYIESLRAPR